MKEISLRNYESVKKFIEAVEHAPAWEVIATEDYEEALEKVGLEFFLFRKAHNRPLPHTLEIIKSR